MTTRMPKLVGEGEEEYYEGAKEAYEREEAATAAQVRRTRIAARKPKEKAKPRQVEHPLGTPIQKGELKPTPVRAHVFSLDRAANPPRRLTNELREIGLDLVPVYGTYRSAKALADQWKGLSLAQRISGVALTGVSAVGDVFIVVGAVKGGVAVVKVSARVARRSPQLVRRILTEETGAISVGRAPGVEVVSATGRTSAGGVSGKLRDELAEVLRKKGFGEGAAPKATPKAGLAVKATEFIYVGPPGATSFRIPTMIRQALGLPSGRYMATGASARLTEGIVTAFPKADPEQKARIADQIHNEIKTGKIILVDDKATVVSTQPLTQKKTGTGTIITVIEKERVKETRQTKTTGRQKPRPVPTEEKVTPTPKPARTGRAQPGRPRAPGPGRPLTPTPGPPAPRFKFKGRSLPTGQYPRVVSYRQGFIRWYQDLDTGKRTPKSVIGARGSVDPWRSFRIETTDKTPPKAQLIDLGLFDVSITERGIGRFRRRDTGLHDRSMTTPRGRP